LEGEEKNKRQKGVYVEKYKKKKIVISYLIIFAVIQLFILLTK